MSSIHLTTNYAVLEYCSLRVVIRSRHSVNNKRDTKIEDDEDQKTTMRPHTKLKEDAYHQADKVIHK